MRPVTALSNPVSQTFHHGKTRSFTPNLSNISQNYSTRKHARNASQIDSYIAPLAGVRSSHIQPRDGEKQEIANQLGVLKKKFNTYREEYEKDDLKLGLLNTQFQQFKEIEESCLAKITRQETKLKSLIEKTDETKKNQISEDFNRQVNFHMLERMRQTKIHLDFKKNSLKENIKLLDYYLFDEQRKNLVTRDGKYKGILAYKSLQQSVYDNHKEHHLQLEKIENDYKFTVGANDRREDRKKRQEDIAEAAANEDRDRRYNDMREGLIIYRFWYKHLGRSLEVQMEKSKDIEEAFQKIRAVTGLYDISEVVQRFLTRETSYAQLTAMVTDCKNVCDGYKKKNTELVKTIYEFKLADQVNKAANLDTLKSKISEDSDKLAKVKEKCFTVKETKINVLLWAKKMLTRFNPALAHKNTENVKEVMRLLAHEVQKGVKKTQDLNIDITTVEKNNLTEIGEIFKRLTSEQQEKMLRIDPEDIIKRSASIEDLNPSIFNGEIIEDITEKKHKHPFAPEKESSGNYKHPKYEKHK